MIILQEFKKKCKLLLMFMCTTVVMKSHEGGSDGSGSRHACIITVFLLIRLLYLLIHSLNYLCKSIQILTMLTDFINFIMIFSLIIYCSLNSSLKLIFSHWYSHSELTHFKKFHFFIMKQQQYWLCRIKQRL